MNRGARAHPPKKKHANKPRPEPVVPLSDQERSSAAKDEFDKAIVHLREAEALAVWGQAPNACIHAAYYAMHHCAAAAILASGGVGKRRDYPKSHEHVIEHYGKLVSGEAGDLGRSGELINRARGERISADYGSVRGAATNDAASTAADARIFVNACAAKWGFKDS